jgi:transcriptional regulator with XRE-family HTH domain
LSELRRLREEAGLTQKQLADQGGLTDRTISGLELGTTRPSLETLLRLRRCLGDEAVLAMLNELEDTMDLSAPQKPGRPREKKKER